MRLIIPINHLILFVFLVLSFNTAKGQQLAVNSSNAAESNLTSSAVTNITENAVPENANANDVQNGKSDGNESGNDGAVSTDGSGMPKTVSVDDPLERMLARQQQVEAEAEKENAEKLKQVKSLKDPGEIGEDQHDADLRSLFLAAENKEIGIEVATDWETGNRLTAENLKDYNLVVMDADEWSLKYVARSEKATNPIRLQFENANVCSKGENPLQLTMKYCLEKDMNCDESLLVCFVGKQDPKNKPNVEEKYALPNTNPDLVAKCREQLKNSAEWQKEWANKELHAFLVKTIKGGKVEMQSSFNAKGPMIALNVDGCFELDIATEKSLIGDIRDGGEIQIQSIAERNENFWLDLANGRITEFAGQPLATILPFHILGNFDPAKALFAFIGSKQCGFIVNIMGEALKKCQDQKCEDTVKPPPKTASQIQKSYYKTEFSDDILKPVLGPNELPPQYRSVVMFEKEKKTGKPRAILTTQGWELPFAVATDKLEPPILQMVHPPNAVYCTGRGTFDDNELVLSYNGRPDCFARFAWGERKMRFRDDMNIENLLLIVKDVNITMKGSNKDEFWGHDQFGEPKMLGRGTCPIQAKTRGKPIMHEEKEYRYIWNFVINPQKGDMPRAKPPACLLALAVYLDDYVLMVGSKG